MLICPGVIIDGWGEERREVLWGQGVVRMDEDPFVNGRAQTRLETYIVPDHYLLEEMFYLCTICAAKNG